MKIGVTLRNMGLQSSAEIMRTGALAAQELKFESIWVTDHIAIPPDDAEGSGGRYTDTLGTLAWLAGLTNTIKLGAGVLILPYRPKLPTAKLIATIQELSGERLILGVGTGWMDAEFRALGVPRSNRGKLTDEMLDFLQTCFSQDEVSLNEQSFLFKPRPNKPEILVGGKAKFAHKRALHYADGWLPMAKSPAQIEADVLLYKEQCAQQGKPGNVTVMTSLPIEDQDKCSLLLDAYKSIGVDRIVCAVGYQTATEYSQKLGKLSEVGLE